MKLPEGFTLEENTEQSIKLPKGFTLESTQPVVNQEEPSFLTQLGRGAASLADTTVGAVLPTVAGMATYPVARAFMSPEEASATTERVVGAVDKPFGKAFGVANTPEYTGEASQQMIAFIGANINKGAQWISQQTGLPVSDVENMLGTLSMGVPAVARPLASKASELASAAASNVKAGTRLAFDKPLTAREQRLSSEDYQRGPQIEAAQDAQRLGLAIPPELAQPGVSTRLMSTVAGEEGPARLSKVNQQNVRRVALNELGLSPNTQLNNVNPFKEARDKVAAPYNKVRQLPTMLADDITLSALDALMPDSTLIGANTSTKAITGIIIDAKKKVSQGINGNDLLRNVEQLRKRSRKVYNNKSADVAALDKADVEIGVANVLESMIESNIFNPKLLDEFRGARKQMAKSYAYQDATDLNTGIVNATKLAERTSKDNALTGDIAALGRVAGNFPDAFGGASKELLFNKFRRAGLAGTAGGLAGYAIGDGIGGAIGAAAGAAGATLGRNAASRYMASPEYQKGLGISDYRIPAAAQAVTAQAPIPNSNAIVPYQAPVEVFNKGEGPYVPNFVRQSSRPDPVVTVNRFDTANALPAPSAQGTLNTLRAEDARRSNVSRSIGQDREAAQAASESANRRPTSGEVILDFDPITGKFSEVRDNLKGSTKALSTAGSSLESAAVKISNGTRFDMTAVEKIAWERTKVDVAMLQPGFKTLTDKAIAEKMLDREWIAETVKKSRERADAYAKIAERNKKREVIQTALVEREKYTNLAEQLEDSLSASRPNNSRKQQGPKTKAAIRESNMTQDPGMFTVDVDVSSQQLRQNAERLQQQ
jgi:hypothetical protein